MRALRGDNLEPVGDGAKLAARGLHDNFVEALLCLGAWFYFEGTRSGDRAPRPAVTDDEIQEGSHGGGDESCTATVACMYANKLGRESLTIGQTIVDENLQDIINELVDLVAAVGLRM